MVQRIFAEGTRGVFRTLCCDAIEGGIHEWNTIGFLV